MPTMAMNIQNTHTYLKKLTLEKFCSGKFFPELKNGGKNYALFLANIFVDDMKLNIP
jgi:hypothetical protein